MQRDNNSASIELVNNITNCSLFCILEIQFLKMRNNVQNIRLFIAFIGRILNTMLIIVKFFLYDAMV